MYDREHRFFASALVVSLVACVAFAAALGLAPTQKAYADSEITPQASGYTEVQLLEYINSNMENLLTGLGMFGENTSQTHPAFRWLYTSISQINNYTFQIYAHLDNIEDYILRVSNSLDLIRGALVADQIEINGQTQTTVRNYARLAAENTDSMTTIMQAWNQDMGASLNGNWTDATWFSTVSSRLLAMVNAINSANTNLISIDSKFWEYFLVPQRWQQQDGSYYYSPAYYFQYLKLQYDQMQSQYEQMQKYFLTANEINVNGTNYITPRWYLKNMYDNIVSTRTSVTQLKNDVGSLYQLLSQEQITINGNSVATPYYYLKTLNSNISSMNTDVGLLVKLLSQDTVTINGQTVNTPYYYLRTALEPYQGHAFTYWAERIYEALTKDTIVDENGNSIKTIRYHMWVLQNSVGYNPNGWIDMETLNRNLGYFRESWNQAVIDTKTYLDSIINLLQTPDSQTSQQLIGDFDDEAYAQNMQDLRQQLGQVGVFSAVTSLGMIVYTISDADTLQTPSLDVPFEFAGSNDHLVIDLSWLDDFKPMINFACMALLFLQLSAWTVEAVKET